MRKVKLLALLLAALMVVTAFAGCANTTEIEGEVDGLESRVEALEGAIGNVQGTVDGLKDSVAGIDSSIAGNNDAIKDVADVLAGLKDQIAELEKAPVETKPVESETQAPETEKPAGDSDEALKTKANELGLKIGQLLGTLKVDEEHYLDADYVAAFEAITAAQTAIASSKTVAGMDALYNALVETLKDYVRVDVKFYNYYLALKGNYNGSVECLELVDEALAWYATAEEHYNGVADWEKNLKDANGKKVDLANLKTEMEGWDDEYDWIVDEAEDIVDDIEALDLNATYTQLRSGIGADYKAWLKRVNALCPALVSLVSNYADYEAALAASEVNEDAERDLALLTVKNYTDNTLPVKDEVALFDNYNALKTPDNAHLVFVFRDINGEVVETADIYADIIAAIDAWADEYDLDAKTVEHMINKNFGSADKYFYATFLNQKAFVEDMAKKSVEFKDGLAKSIKALNSKRMINVNESFVLAYEANTKAIMDWYKSCYDAYVAALNAAIAADKVAGNATKVVAKEGYEAIFEKNFNEMVLAAGLGRYCEKHETYVFNTTVDLKAAAHTGAATCVNTTYTSGLDEANNFVLLYNFTEGATMLTFLNTTYGAAKTVAKNINKTIADWDIDSEKTIVTFLDTVSGYYAAPVVENGYTYLRLRDDLKTDVKGALDDLGNPTGDGIPDFLQKADNSLKDVTTIAAYMATYGKGGTKTDKADLSALIDNAAYKAAVEAIKAQLVKINTATAALNAAYVDLLGEGAEVVVNTSNKGKVATLVEKLDAWKKAAGRTDAVLAEVVDTKNGFEEFELINIVDSYDALKVNDFKAVTAKLQNRVNQLNNEQKALVSLFNAIEKLNGVTEITVDTLLSNNSTLTDSNLAYVALAQKDKDSDGKYDYKLTYITYDAEKHQFVEKTNWNLYGSVGKNDMTAALKKGATWMSDSSNLYSGATTVNATFASLESAWKDKTFKVSDLIAIATNLYAKFMVNNYGIEVSDVETAKKNFAGYEFTALVAYIAKDLSKPLTEEQIAAGLTPISAAELTAIKTCVNKAELKNVLNSVEEKNSALMPAGYSFGGYTVAQMQGVANDAFKMDAADANALIALLDAAGIEAETDDSGAVVVESIDVAATTIWTK